MVNIKFLNSIGITTINSDMIYGVKSTKNLTYYAIFFSLIWSLDRIVRLLCIMEIDNKNNNNFMKLINSNLQNSYGKINRNLMLKSHKQESFNRQSIKKGIKENVIT